MIAQERRGEVDLIWIDRHERRNAVDVEHCYALQEALENLARGGTRVVVITGRGSSFCAGADLGDLYEDGFRDALYRMLRAITDLPVPVIAAVNGPAIGAGAQLAIACDLRVADPSAVFAVPTARYGLAVNPWTIRRLGLLAGGGTARSLLLGGEQLDAELAYRRGLVDRVAHLEGALSWAEELGAFAPVSLRYSKLALDSLFEPRSSDGSLEANFQACWRSEDVAEGRRARSEKRPPRFESR